jgi:alanine dehydrogenase
MDLSIDMGGCCETSRPSFFPEPVYVVDDILHFCVPNLPTVAARSATLALTNALLPVLLDVVEKGVDRAITENRDFGRGVYLHRGVCTKESLAELFNVPFAALPAAGR